jgi:hypothetical protein
MARKEPTDLTIKRLYALSGNRCAFPNCTATFVSFENEKNISNICHIEAAESNGERYNSSSTDEERRSFENLILLCPNHHKETDDVNKYTVEVLRKMKQEHELKMLKPEILQKYPSALNDIIKFIGDKIYDYQTNESQDAPDIQDKILYNNVILYEPIIAEYSIYQARLNALYKEIENRGSTRKEYVLQAIRVIYLQEKGRYKNINEVRKNADNIITAVKNKLWDIIDSSKNVITDMPKEVIENSVLVILVDAFMRCNILEEPKYDS